MQVALKVGDSFHQPERIEETDHGTFFWFKLGEAHPYLTLRDQGRSLEVWTKDPSLRGFEWLINGVSVKTGTFPKALLEGSEALSEALEEESLKQQVRSVLEWDRLLAEPIYRDFGEVTVIVATPDMTKPPFTRCYEHLKRHTRTSFQIIVVETHFDEPLYNHARDMNIALKGIDSDYYVLMNDDLYVYTGWLDALIQPTLMDPTVGVTGGLFLYPDRRTIQHAGIYCDRNHRYQFGHRFHFRDVEQTPDALKQSQVIGVTGALTLITRKCRDRIGTWDSEKFPLGWNDPDFCLRAWLDGYKVVYAPGCVAIHEEGLTLKKEGMVSKAHQTCYPNFVQKWPNEVLGKVLDMVRDEAVIPYLREVHKW